MNGAGNDFILIDNRTLHLRFTPHEIAHLCHRKLGIGADGLMTLDTPQANEDFVMHYYNADGSQASMCGNGGRCIAMFAHLLGFGQAITFLASDGMHHAEIIQWDNNRMQGIVKLGMQPVVVADITTTPHGTYLNTGVPHCVKWVEDIDNIDVKAEGRRIRNEAIFAPEGTNVDFIEADGSGNLRIRTYERGVEDETWACGTGVTAAAIVANTHSLMAVGGNFMVDWDTPTPDTIEHITLTGPVEVNFKGEWTYLAPTTI